MEQAIHLTISFQIARLESFSLENIAVVKYGVEKPSILR